MKLQSPLQERNWRLLYFQYQNSPKLILGVFGGIIAVSFFLVVMVIKPQFQNYLSLRQEESRTRSLIQTIQQNTQKLQLLSDDSVEQQFQTAVTALPAERDFAGIISTIFSAAARANVSLSDYSFSVNSSGTSAAQTTADTMDINLTLGGSITDAEKFCEEIKTKIPIAEVKKISSQGGAISSDVQFTFRPLPQSAPKDTEPLQIPTDKYQSLLSTLSDWQNQSISLDALDTAGSSSAVQASPF